MPYCLHLVGCHSWLIGSWRPAHPLPAHMPCICICVTPDLLSSWFDFTHLPEAFSLIAQWHNKLHQSLQATSVIEMRICPHLERQYNGARYTDTCMHPSGSSIRDHMRIHSSLIFMKLAHGLPAVGPKEVPAGLSAGQGERLGAEEILCSWRYTQGLQYAAF